MLVQNRVFFIDIQYTLSQRESTKHITEETSLLVRDQCLWLLGLSLAHELAPTQSCTSTNVQTIICLTLKLSRTCYRRNYVPTNQDHFGYPRTLTPRNKNVFLKYICVFFLSISQFFPTLNYISRNSAAKIYTYRNIFNEQTFCFWQQETPRGCFIIFWLFFLIQPMTHCFWEWQCFGFQTFKL